MENRSEFSIKKEQKKLNSAICITLELSLIIELKWRKNKRVSVLSGGENFMKSKNAYFSFWHYIIMSF
ncbi:unnamed protein product [Moneuplotes crassus]|uniref:Uncharacterized protein n=1 Tax=Euplotes crassus TaxID=5936 RepID=A0AAD1UPS3_EUPCR|nr:unnamed protein product [Moneuplotes crassus]